MPTYGAEPVFSTAEQVRATGPLNGHGAADPLAPVQVELEGYFHDLTTLNSLPSTECFMMLSAISARAAEIRSRLMSMDSRRGNAMRLRHVDPLLDEVDRQFKIHSRIQSVRQMEWETSKGQT
jgi:hypothetical protein